MAKRRDLLTFIETTFFSARWDDLKLTIRDLVELQQSILTNPKSGKVMNGTGGIRKVRFAPSAQRRGKSGAFRVCYVYFEEFGVVLLVLVYPKNERDNLYASEKRELRDYVERQRKAFAKRAAQKRREGE